MATFTPNMNPVIPARKHSIGIIGAGGVVQYGHLPAYHKAGFDVVAVASRSQATVERAMTGWGIPLGFTDWHALLDLPEVEVVDVTYPFDDERLLIVREAAARGKHIMMQKPMAHSLETAEAIVRIAGEAGVKLAVNQNARWCPQYLAARQAIAQGLVGDIYFLIHEMQNTQDSQEWFTSRWYAQQPRFQILEYSVHHLDLMRFWAGIQPQRVMASVARKPGQTSTGEMIAGINLEFPGQALGIVVDDNASYPAAVPRSRFRIEGTHGMIEGEAMGTPGFTLYSDLLKESPQSFDLSGSWFPDAFIGTMGELLCAIEEDREPSISGRDNLDTMRLVFSAYDSLAERVG